MGTRTGSLAAPWVLPCAGVSRLPGRRRRVARCCQAWCCQAGCCPLAALEPHPNAPPWHQLDAASERGSAIPHGSGGSGGPCVLLRGVLSPAGRRMDATGALLGISPIKCESRCGREVAGWQGAAGGAAGWVPSEHGAPWAAGCRSGSVTPREPQALGPPPAWGGGFVPLERISGRCCISMVTLTPGLGGCRVSTLTPTPFGGLPPLWGIPQAPFLGAASFLW